MGEADLCRVDVTCKLLGKLNCVSGPWRSLGCIAVGAQMLRKANEVIWWPFGRRDKEEGGVVIVLRSDMVALWGKG